MRRACFFLLLGLVLNGGATAWADSINIGDIYLNLSNSPSIVTINVDDFTGLSSTGSSDFPVSTNVVFSNVALAVSCFNAQCATDLGAPQITYSGLGPLDPSNGTGSLTGPGSSPSDEFSQIVLTADLSATQLTLFDNSVFTGSSSISFTFLPNPNNNGGTSDFLVACDPAGDPCDLGILTDTGSRTAVPEPGSVELLGLAFGGLLAWKARKLIAWT